MQLHCANFHETWLVGNPDLKQPFTLSSPKPDSEHFWPAKSISTKRLDGQEGFKKPAVIQKHRANDQLFTLCDISAQGERQGADFPDPEPLLPESRLLPAPTLRYRQPCVNFPHPYKDKVLLLCLDWRKYEQYRLLANHHAESLSYQPIVVQKAGFVQIRVGKIILKTYRRFRY